MLEVVEKIVYNVTGKKGLTMDTDFVSDLGLNSLDIINLVSAFEKHFNTKVPNRDIWNLRQVRDVVDYINGKGYIEKLYIERARFIIWVPFYYG